MARSAKRSRKKRAPRAAAASVIDNAPVAVVERPDGYDLQVADGHQEFGLFESHELAQADRDSVCDEALAPGETLQEAVHEIGIADWFDAESGQPTEGESPPHLKEGLWPRGSMSATATLAACAPRCSSACASWRPPRCRPG